MQDDQLLIQYARTESDAAFSQIVARHLPLVYRTCRRELGSGTLAEDAAQVVFLLLARKAKTLRAVPSLAGWLFQTARFVAKDVRKQELRRKRREEAVMQESISQQVTPIPDWNSIEPLLNNALAALKPAEREAVLLRFFEGHTLAETGAFLGLSEDAARMRCARALEKLRRYLTAHGAAVTSVVLTGFLTSEAAHPVPAHAAATIAQGTLQAISTGPTANVLLLSKGVSHTMKIIKIKFAAAAAFVVLGGAALPPLVHAFSPHKPGVQTIATPGQLLLSGVQRLRSFTSWRLSSPLIANFILELIRRVELICSKRF
jgi:RNA polymerase sigma factor (sigma-70 family)